MLWYMALWGSALLWNIAQKVDKEEQQFIDFINRYNKGYVAGTEKYQQKFEIFKEALDEIKALNRYRRHAESAVFGLNPFADLEPNEFRRRLIRKRRPSRPLNNIFKGFKLRKQAWSPPNDIPRRVDWREKSVIGSVITQGECGSCWAHTIADTLSSMVAIKSGEWIKFSSQQILDCLPEESGCEGGDLCTAIKWLADHKTYVTTEKQYPDKDITEPCLMAKPDTGVRISNYTCRNFTGQENEMLRLLANHGPIMAAVDASIWKYYINGTIDSECGKEPDHAAQIVGYNLDGNPPYYIVRNSWGKEFGLDGYIQLAIGDDTCAVAGEIAAISIETSW